MFVEKICLLEFNKLWVLFGLIDNEVIHSGTINFEDDYNIMAIPFGLMNIIVYD